MDPSSEEPRIVSGSAFISPYLPMTSTSPKKLKTTNPTANPGWGELVLYNEVNDTSPVVIQEDPRMTRDHDFKRVFGDENLPSSLDLNDLGDREPSWAAWCLASRSPPNADMPKRILQPGPYYGHTLKPCDVGHPMCRRHGVLRGSMNEISTNGTAFDFGKDEEPIDSGASYSVSGKDIFDAQSTMMVSRERSRREYRNYDNEVRELNPRKMSKLISQQYFKMIPSNDKISSISYAKTTSQDVTLPDYKFLHIHSCTPLRRARAARDHRVALALTDSNKHSPNGKYKPLTLMGPPTEISLRIMDFHFRDMQLDSNLPNVACTYPPSWHPSAGLTHRKIVNLLPHGPIKFPLAILQASKQLYSASIRIFQRNALFVSQFDAFDERLLEKPPGVMLPWPNLSRREIRILGPDENKRWGKESFIQYTESQVREYLPRVLEQYMRQAFGNGNKLDELHVALGPDVTRDYGYAADEWLPDFARLIIIKSLMSLAGKVKSLRIGGRLIPRLAEYADQMEIFVQDGSIEAPVEPKLSELRFDDFSDTDDGSDEDDISDMEEIFYLLASDAYDENIVPETGCFVGFVDHWADSSAFQWDGSGERSSNSAFGDIPASIRKWFRSNPVSSILGTRSQSPQQQAKLIECPSQEAIALMDRLGTDYGTTRPILDILEQLTNLTAEECKLLGISKPTGTHVWIDIVQISSHEGPSVAERAYEILSRENLFQKGPTFLTWPNSDTELAARVTLPADSEDTISVPLVAYNDTGNPRNLWIQVNIDFRARLIAFGSIPHVHFAKAGHTKGIWYQLKMPSCLSPPSGIYRLEKCHSLRPRMQRRASKNDSSEDEEAVQTDFFNIKPEYNGPEDDGLGWLDDKEGFEVDLQHDDFLVGY